MSQEKTQKSFKHQVVSEDAKRDEIFRKTEQVMIPGNSKSFTKGFVLGDNREENFAGWKLSGGPKPYPATGADLGSDQFASFKPLQMSVESKQKDNLTRKTAEVWNGPLSRYNTYTSKKNPEECMKAIEESLSKLEREKLVDWEIEAYNVFGRMYHGLEMSEYMINVYTSSDNEYKSVIEVRRSSGDTFVHDEFFGRISKLLGEERVFERKEDECEVDFGFSLALEPLSLSSLAQLEPLDNDLLKELTSSKDGMSDDETNLSEITETTSIQQLGEELIEVVTDRTSYQEAFRHSSAVLCQDIQTNPQLLQYVASQKKYC